MSKNLEYNIRVEWDKASGGEAYFKENPPMKFDMPKDFGGDGKHYCSDEIFLTAVSGCLLETFLYISKRMRIKLKELRIQAGSKIESSRWGYYIRQLSFHFEIAAPEKYRAKVEECLDLAVQYCHLTRAISPNIKMNFTKLIMPG